MGRRIRLRRREKRISQIELAGRLGLTGSAWRGLQQIAKILGGKAGRTFDYAAVNENKVSRRHNRKRLPDSGFDEDTECGLLRVPLDIIDQRFSLLDCHRSTYRRHTRLLFSITKSDFPSPTTLKQLTTEYSTPLYSIRFPPHNNVCEGRLVWFLCWNADFKITLGQDNFLRTPSVPSLTAIKLWNGPPLQKKSGPGFLRGPTLRHEVHPPRLQFLHCVTIIAAVNEWQLQTIVAGRSMQGRRASAR